MAFRQRQAKQRRSPCRPQQASPQRHRAQSLDKGIPRERVSRAAAEGRRAECVCEAESELESVTPYIYTNASQSARGLACSG